MHYYWFNRQEILQKAKEEYSKEKAAKYYKQNKEAIKKVSKSIKEYQKKYPELVQYKKNKYVLFFS